LALATLCGAKDYLYAGIAFIQQLNQGCTDPPLAGHESLNYSSSDRAVTFQMYQ